MRIPNAAHEARPWVIREIAPDFHLLDAWALPVDGRREDFNAFLEGFAAFDPAHAGPFVVRALFWARIRLGALLGWDETDAERSIPGTTESRLSARLPHDLRGSADELAKASPLRHVAGGFAPLYRTDDEFAAEVSNKTVHGVLHIGWVRMDNDRYRAQMGVYVKPRGKLGEVYLKAIAPFRHLIVYPALLREIERTWRARVSTQG